MKSLYNKISLVMDDIKYLQKDSKISFGSTNYKAISEEKVTEAVRKALISRGLVILPVVQEHKREDITLKDKNGNEKVERFATVNVQYKICDIETGEFEIVVSSGCGVDSQDKCIGKAMTYAYKYMLLRTFAIPTGDDPDIVLSEETDNSFGKTQIQPQTQQKITDPIKFITSHPELFTIVRDKKLTQSIIIPIVEKYGADHEAIKKALLDLPTNEKK